MQHCPVLPFRYRWRTAPHALASPPVDATPGDEHLAPVEHHLPTTARPTTGTRRNAAEVNRMRRSTTQRDRDRDRIRRTRPACHICGEPIDYTLPYLDPREFTVDHVIPLAAGGRDTLDNKRAAHRACNRAKGVRDYAPIVRRSGSLG